MQTDDPQDLLTRAYFIIGAVEDFCPGLTKTATRWQEARVGRPPDRPPTKPAVLTYDDLLNAFVNANYVIGLALQQLRDINAPEPTKEFLRLFHEHLKYAGRLQAAQLFADDD